MSSAPVVALRCPSCGSESKATEKPAEFVCIKCETRFQLVSSTPTASSTTTALRVDHCSLCDRDLPSVQTTYRCKECGKTDFCASCVVLIGKDEGDDQRSLCRTCMNRKGMACSFCNNYASRVCMSCSRRGCDEHEGGFFDLPISSVRGAKIYHLKCPTCGQLCIDCTEINSDPLNMGWSFTCVKCGNQFKPDFEPGRGCGSCGRTIPKTAQTCPYCGKQQVSTRVFLQLRPLVLRRHRSEPLR
jgi:RNA polymerase subunit RPABC4/transcription elongation factor Spt4